MIDGPDCDPSLTEPIRAELERRGGPPDRERSELGRRLDRAGEEVRHAPRGPET